MTYYVLYNPLSGNGKVKEEAMDLSDIYGADLIFTDITKIENYESFLANMKGDSALILCGGDGTINRFVNDTEHIERKCNVYYKALGTGNDFWHDIGKSKDDEPICIDEYIKELPLVEVKGKKYRFLNNVGFGIDGYCCEVGDELKKKSDKPVNYTAIAIKGLLFNYKPTDATVIVDGKKYTFKKVWIAPTMNGRFYGGGMMATPDQNRNDPEKKLSVMIFHGKGRLRTLMVFPSIFKGEHVKHKNMVTILTGKEISVTFDRPAPLQIDGETVLGVTSYNAYASKEAEVKV